jgi:hypothetical protein
MLSGSIYSSPTTVTSITGRQPSMPDRQFSLPDKIEHNFLKTHSMNSLILKQVLDPYEMLSTSASLNTINFLPLFNIESMNTRILDEHSFYMKKQNRVQKHKACIMRWRKH